MHRIFISLYYLIERYRLIAALLALAFLTAGAFYASRIKFEEDISQMLPKNGKSDITAQVLSQLEFSDKIIVLINTRSDGVKLTETADAFIERLEPLSPYIKSVQGKVDEDQISETFDFAQQNIPLLLDEDDYGIIADRISGDSINQRLAANYRALSSPAGLFTRDFIKKDPLGITALGLQKLNLLGENKDFLLQDDYIVSKDGKNILLFLEPSFGGAETKNNEIFAEQLNIVKDSLNREFRGQTEVSFFGAPLIAAANAKQIKKDIQTTVLISTGVLLLLLIFYFRNLLAPIIIFIPTVFGAVTGLIFIYVIKDSISAISLSVSAILIGITIDYAIHILTHYKHNNDIEDVLKEITHPIIMSASTTAVSFLCLVFVRSEALRDLGIFASVTVIFSALFTLVLIPHLYRPGKTKTAQKKTFIDKIGAYPYEKNRALVIICSLLIVISFFGFSHIKFNQNISDLNFVPEEMKQNERKLQQLSDLTEKSIHVVSYGTTPSDAVDRNTKLLSFLKDQQKQENILSFQSVGEVVLSEKEQQQRIRRWNQFWTAKRKADVISKIKMGGAVLGFNHSAFAEFEEMLNRNYQPLSLNGYSKLPALQLSEFYRASPGMHTLSTIVKVDEAQRAQFISDVEKYNEVLAIDRQQINENFLGLLKDDFNNLINYSLIAVILIFLIFFRNTDLTVMAVIPIVLSGVVTAGILYFMGLELNIFSTIVCTLIFGAGVDFNIFLTQALQKEISTGKDQLPLYRVSIILALITTVLAVGALIFAKHPALHSVSTVALVGMVAVVVISFALYPLMFGYIRKRSQKGLMPVTLRVLLNSVFSLVIYALGGIVFGIIAPFFSRRNEGKLKKIVASYLTMVLYTNPFVRKRVINQTGEKFEKPAVVIANHTSSLDILAMAMTTHKLIFFVNDWVYHSPIFGRLVRRLGFFPVSEGLEGNMDRLKKKVDQGYSLMIFPEGERSNTNSIQRFHKGAFYLAQHLKLDILPVYIHGNSEVMPKGDLFIHDGSITVVTGKRIAWDDMAFGGTYQQRSKKVNALFREQFSILRKELENEDYFTKQILMNYHYMEKEIVKDVHADWKRNKSLYHELNRWIGPQEHVLHLSADYGQLDLLLVLQQARREITSYNSDRDKRDTARQSYLIRRRKLYYPDAPEYTERVVDVLLISDPESKLNDLPVLPRRIIVLNRSDVQLPEGYEVVAQKDGLTVFNIMDKFNIFVKIHKTVMPKKILVTYYSQTGQLEEIMKNIAGAFQDRSDFEVTYFEIKLKEDFEFPWKPEVFYDTFPESYLQVPREIIPPSEDILNKKYDLILFGYQVWFLTPSIPVISFLKSEFAERLMAHTPVVTVSGTRNMWMLSQDKLKVHLKRLHAELVGNIALVDRHDNYTSVITILNWMQTGNKEQKKPLPPAGVAQKEIDEAGKYGKIIMKYAENGSYVGMQKELVRSGAVEVRPFLIKVETVGNKLFTVFSGIIAKKPQSRKFWVAVYKFYLMFAIWVVSPIVLFFYTLLTPFFFRKRKKQIEHYQGL